MVNNVQYKWKAADGDISRWNGSKKWRCTLLSGDLRDAVSVPGTQGQGRSPIATFTPPQQRLRNSELHIFADLPQQPRIPVFPHYGYPVSNSASTRPGIPSHFPPSHSPRPSTSLSTGERQPRNHVDYTAVGQLGGQARPQTTIWASFSTGGESARVRPPVRPNTAGFSAPFPAPLAQATTSSFPRANEVSSQNLIGPRRNRGPSDGVLTGAMNPSASERCRPAPSVILPVALQPPPLAMIDGLVTCCILLAAGRLEYRDAQTETSAHLPLAPPDQGTSDRPQLTPNRQESLGVSLQIALPDHILDIQKQLYERYMAAGSSTTLPMYEAAEERSGGGFRSIESPPSSLPPSYSTMGGE
jgi:hypothetical protein